MCDTMVALGNSTADGSVIFAKNSDRQPNEPHLVIRVPRERHQEGTKIECTYIEIEQVSETYEVLLLKPSWIWGCEMGCNEFGLNIGNEAVFTKEKYGKDSLIGMDMVRLALERCKTSEEALHVIVDLLTRYGQGGNCGFRKKFTYHNSFLIADRTSAWVLETAGEYWAAERVTDVRSISNCLTIGKDFDLSHPDLIQHAVDKGWCKNARDFHFANCYSNRVVTKLSGARSRYNSSNRILQKDKGHISVATMKNILRSHEPKTNNRQFEKSSLRSVCMHGGFIYGDHTTGSYIASINDALPTYWITGSSTPCISIYKPFWLVEGENLTFRENETAEAIEFWKKRERLHRMFIENRVSDPAAYIEQKEALEDEFDKAVSSIDFQNLDESQLARIVNHALAKEQELVGNTIEANESNPSNIKGNLYYRHYWSKQNKELYCESDTVVGG